MIGQKGEGGQAVSEGPFRPNLPDVPQSWFDFLSKLATWTATVIAFGTLLLTQVQSCQSRNVQVEHGEAIEANKEKIEKHAEKISELKSAVGKEP